MTAVSDLYNELRTLIAERDARTAEYDAALERFHAAKPAVPDEICVRGANDRMTLDSAWFRPCSFQVAVARGVPQMIPAEGWKAMLADPPRMFGSDETNERALARIRIGLAAAEAYEAALAEASRVSGCDAAEKADTAATEAVWALERAIEEAVPETLDDARIKAEVFIGSLGDEKPDALLEAFLRSLADLPSAA